MIDEAERFVRRNTRVAAKITGFERREVTEYPYPAVREAIANGVAHRDYWRRDVEVRVSIFAGRIEVQSPGRLPAPLTFDREPRRTGHFSTSEDVTIVYFSHPG